MNIAGVGIVKSTKHLDSAKLLVEFLVAQAGQKLFAELDKEYPLHQDVKADPALVDRKSFRAHWSLSPNWPNCASLLSP